ncbi:MAG: hypothetical protein P8O83_02195 [Flavobacteriaceae bacterium]|nr:hypothetical protein [Flavobacteriaceae bacterium]
MENTDYSIKYLKTCACGCGTKFNGRLNQKYFNTSHKAKANNLKAAKRRKELSSIFARMEVNYFIFLEMKENDKLGVWFDISEVIRKGFDPNIPTNQLKNSKDGSIHHRIADFVYKISEDGLQIIIHQYNN